MVIEAKFQGEGKVGGIEGARQTLNMLKAILDE